MSQFKRYDPFAIEPVGDIFQGLLRSFRGATDAYSQLCAASAEVVTCDTIPHPSNQIALTEPLVGAVSRMFDLPLPLNKRMFV